MNWQSQKQQKSLLQIKKFEEITQVNLNFALNLEFEFYVIVFLSIILSLGMIFGFIKKTHCVLSVNFFCGF